MHERSGEGVSVSVPAEFSIGGVYMPPLLIASILGIITAVMVARLLNTYHLSRYFFYPPLVFVAMVMIFTVIYGALIVPF